MEKTVSEAIEYRRSIRIYKDDSIDTEKVKACIKNAILAPNSSNLQLWEFYHITNKEVLQKLTAACLGQNAAKHAKEIVVVVVRKDLWRKRAASNISFLKKLYGDKSSSEYSKREKLALNYYQKLIPTIYFDFLGIAGFLKFLVFQIVGLFRPTYRQTRASDMRIIAHKSAGLAAQNFMMGMAAIGYDTCPMEGTDSLRVKKIVGIPARAEINMVISCGIRDEKGVYGPRYRIPFEEVYYHI